MEPLYRELHAFTRRKLHQLHPDQVPQSSNCSLGTSVYCLQVKVEGPLTAHLLGDMWGRFWNNLYPILQPFKELPKNIEREFYTLHRLPLLAMLTG